MRVLFFILLLLIPTFVLISPASSVFAAEESYICPMHPHISGKEGDSCPICGMTLVPKMQDVPPMEEKDVEDGAGMQNHSSHHSGHSGAVASSAENQKGAFRIDPSYVHVLGVKTAEVAHHEFGKAIRGFGKIEPSTRLEQSIDVRTKGWIVDLATDAIGDNVKKGDLLFTYYSPDLMTAQSDYLIGSRIGNSKNRLYLFGMDDRSIALLKKKKKPLEATPFYAPADGTITQLPVRKGAYVKEGARIMMLQDFSKLWVDVDVPLRDVQFLSLGTPVKITLPETGGTYESVVDFIHPVNDPKSRTVKVRVILDNPDGTLKPDTYVDALFNADVKARLAVPVETILYGNMGAYVIEDIGDGYFKPVMVQTGITSDGFTEIKSGLTHGQRIVTSGQFMLDAESNLKGGMAAMGHNHGDMSDDKGMTKNMSDNMQSEQEGHQHVH